MKLYNNTKIDDKLLYKVLYMAGKAVGSIRTQKVVIKVTSSVYGSSGHVNNSYGFYREWYLKSKPSQYLKYDKAIRSDGGFMFLKIPVRHWEPLRLAEEVYRLASHEWRHIKDVQKKARFGDYNRNWKNRPHERRAMNSEKRAIRIKDKREDIQDAIIALGINIESIKKKK